MQKYAPWINWFEVIERSDEINFLMLNEAYERALGIDVDHRIISQPVYTKDDEFETKVAEFHLNYHKNCVDLFRQRRHSDINQMYLIHRKDSHTINLIIQSMNDYV